MKRLWGIRHLRYIVGLYRVNQHYDLWAKMGMHAFNRPYDLAQLDKIWSGNA